MTSLKTAIIKAAASNPTFRKNIVAELQRTAVSARMIPSLKRKINQDLSRKGFDGRGRWQTVSAAYAAALTLLEAYQIQLDQVIHAGSLRPVKGTLNIDLAFSTSDPFSPESLVNSMLYLSWYQLENGNFEVIAYLT